MAKQLKGAVRGLLITAVAAAAVATLPAAASAQEEKDRSAAGEEQMAKPPPPQDQPEFRSERMRNGRGRGLGGPGPAGRPGGFDRPRGLGGPHGRGLGPPAAQWENLPGAQKKRVEAFVKEHFPSLFVELQKLEDRNPQGHQRRMSRIGPRMMELAELARSDPQRGALAIRERQLDLQIRELSRDFRRSSDDAERRQIRKRVRELCSEEFDSQLNRRALEVSDLEARLAELKERLAENRRMRDELVNSRLKEALEGPRHRGRHGNGAHRGPGSLPPPEEE
jgi:hypothetical protein